MITIDLEQEDKNEARFDKSCVPFKKYKNGGLRSIFRYLRDREDVLLRDIERFKQKKQTDKLTKAKLALSEVRSTLIWMWVNVQGAK